LNCNSLSVFSLDHNNFLSIYFKKWAIQRTYRTIAIFLDGVFLLGSFYIDMLPARRCIFYRLPCNFSELYWFGVHRLQVLWMCTSYSFILFCLSNLRCPSTILVCEFCKNNTCTVIKICIWICNDPKLGHFMN